MMYLIETLYCAFTLADTMPILLHFLKPMERILNFCENLHP